MHVLRSLQIGLNLQELFKFSICRLRKQENLNYSHIKQLHQYLLHAILNVKNNIVQNVPYVQNAPYYRKLESILVNH